MASLYQSLGIAPRDKAYIVGHLAGGVGASYAARDDESRRLSNHDRRPGRPRLAGCGDGSRRDGRPSSSEAAGAPGRAVGLTVLAVVLGLARPTLRSWLM